MAFRFSLDTLLRLHRSREHQERMRLEVLAAQLTRLRVEIAAVQQRFAELRQAISTAPKGGWTGAELHWLVACQHDCRRQLAGLEQQLAEAEQHHRQQLEVYQKARQALDILEQFRLRRLREYRVAEARREQKRLDETHLLARPSGRRLG
jgi:flagellar export protein FliJ